jgi:hypothetical protein
MKLFFAAPLCCEPIISNVMSHFRCIAYPVMFLKDKKIEINGKIPEPWSKCDDKEAFINFIKTVDSQKDKKYNTLFEFELDSWSAK